MESGSNQIQLQFNGYYNTALLWKDKPLFGMEQLQLSGQRTKEMTLKIPDRIRLGNRVELFVFEDLKRIDRIEILTENNQVLDGKITVGELDCILRWNDIPVHLEIVYKFYLYDPETGKDEIGHWIGPNRNDSLLQKLTKLRDKQFPLIDHEQSRELLRQLDIDRDLLQQRVLFKAQLFAPFNQHVKFKALNKDCLQGFYIKQNDLMQFSDCVFFIPKKEDWLLEIHRGQNWLNYEQFRIRTEVMLHRFKAPLSWIKFPDGRIQKFFVVWW